jgi:hypothetical protein
VKTLVNQVVAIGIPDPRWKDLYRIGGISSLLLAGLVVFALIAFFWPYTQRFASTEDIFVSLHTDRMGTLFSLDIMMLVTTFIDILLFNALYVSLKRDNESYALLAPSIGVDGDSPAHSHKTHRRTNFSKPVFDR